MSQIKYLDESGLNVYDHEIKKYIKDKSHVVLPFKISKNTDDSALLNISCSGLKSKKIQNILETIYNNPNSFILLNLDIENKGLVKVVGSVNIIDSATIQVTGSFNYDADHITVDVKFKRIENSWDIIEQVGLISSYPKLDDSTGKIAEEYMPEKIDMAKDLTGVIEATPEEFNFRPSAGNKSIRDESAVIRSIKGNSLVWNQQIKTALSQTDSGANGWWNRQGSDKITLDGRKVSYTVVKTVGSNNQISQKVPIKKDHKYLIHFLYDTHGVINDDFGRAYWVLFSNNVYGEIIQSSRGAQNGITADIIDLFITANSDYEYLILKESYTTGNIVEHIMDFADIQLIDLTQMFGSGNEPTTIEDFYARIPQGIDIFAYNEGQIINNNTNSIKTVGFNQWDEEWEVGRLDINTGLPTNGPTETIRSKNYIRILPNKEYYLRGIRDNTNIILFYDAEYNYIGNLLTANVLNKTFTTPANANYIKLYVGNLNTPVTTYKHDICINLSHSGVRNGEYEPYKENYRALPDIKKYFPDGMKSAGSVYDEITSEKAIRRVGVVDLGALNWEVSNVNEFVVRLDDAAKPADGLCKKYPIDYSSQSGAKIEKTFVLSSNAYNLRILDSSYTDPTAFKTAMQGVMLYYELAEPIETPLEEPIQLDYVVEDWGTEEAISEEPSTQFKANIVYQFNAEGRIRDNSRNIEILENTTVKSIPQSLSEDQKKQVRENIGAPAVDDYDVEINPTLKFIVDENQQTGDPRVVALSEENYVEHNRKVLNYIKDKKDKALHVVIDIDPKGDSSIVSIQCTWAFDSLNDDLILFGETIVGYTRIILSGSYHNFSTDPVLGCSIMQDEMNYVKYNENGKIDSNYLPEYDVEVNPTLKFDVIENTENTSNIDESESVYTIGHLSDENYHYHNVEVLNYITDHQDVGVKMAIYNNGRPMSISSCVLNIDDYNDKKNYNIIGSTAMNQAIYNFQCTYEKVDNIYTLNQSESDFQYFIFPLLNLNTGIVQSGFLPTNKLYFTMNVTDNTVSQNTQYSDSNAQMISDIYSKRSSLSDIEVNAVLESTSSDVLYKLCLSNITKNENGMNLTFTSGNYIALLVELLNNESNDGFEFGNINISNNNPLWEIK